MLGWNKQFLLKRRGYSLSQPFPRKDSYTEQQLTHDIETVISHLRKLLITFLTLKFNAQAPDCLPELDNVKPLQVPFTFSQGSQAKIIKILYRRIQNTLFTFGKQTGIEAIIKTHYQSHIEYENPSAQDFFREVQSVILSQILILKKKRKKSSMYGMDQQIPTGKAIKRKLTMKEIQNQMMQTLYDIMDLSCIEAMDCFIEGVDINDNISLLYGRQKPRNRKIKKQIKEYVQDYQNRNRGRSKVKNQSQFQKQNQVLIDNIKTNMKTSFAIVKEKKSKSSSEARSRIALKPLQINTKKKLKLNR